MLVLHENTLLPEVEKFLAAGPHGAVVGDQRPAAANGETLVTRDPGTGEPLTTVAALQPADVDRAVDVAADAFQSTGWSRLTPHERGKLLHRWVDLVEHRKPIVAQIESLDAGKLLPQADGDVQVFIETFRYYIEMSLHAQRRLTLAVSQHEATSVRQPWGPCGFIFPWNFPILLFAGTRRRLLATGIVVGDDDAVGLFGRDGAHQRPLALVAVAAGTEHDHEAFPDIGPQRFQRLGESVRLVRIVDEYRRAVAMSDQFEAALGAFEAFQRVEHGGGIAPGRDGVAGGHERVFDLEGAHQRQADPVRLTGMDNPQGLGEAVDRDVVEADVVATPADRDGRADGACAPLPRTPPTLRDPPRSPRRRRR